MSFDRFLWDLQSLVGAIRRFVRTTAHAWYEITWQHAYVRKDLQEHAVKSVSFQI